VYRYTRYTFCLLCSWILKIVGCTCCLLIAVAHAQNTTPDVANRYACGQNALYALCRIVGQPISPTDRSYLAEYPGGNSILQLKEAAAGIGFPCVVRRIPFERLASSALPVVAHLGPVGSSEVGHFVVVVKADQQQVYLLDGTTGSFGPSSVHSVQREWSGFILQPIPRLSTNGLNSLDGWLAGSLVVIVVAVVIALAFPPGSLGWSEKPATSAGTPLLAIMITIGVLVSPLFGGERNGKPQSANGNIIWRTPSHDAINCLYIFLRFHNIDVDYLDLLNRLPPTDQGTTIVDLCNLSHHYGFPAAIAKWTPDRLEKGSLPVITHMTNRLDEGGTYVILLARKQNTCFVITGDSAAIETISMDMFRRHWSGYVLTLDNGCSRVTTIVGVCATIVLALYTCMRLLLGRKASVRSRRPDMFLE
jgi:hypothetical protein